MQTSNLLIQSTSGNNTGAAPRTTSAKGGDGSQFGAILSNQMVQRQAPLPAAPKPEAPRPQADKPAQAEKAPAPQQQQQAKTRDAGKADQADAADEADDDSEDGADAAAKADPAAGMLALMASLQQPAQGAAAPGKSAAAQAFDALGGGKARRGDAQLAALQAALKSVSKETGVDGAAAGGKTFSATGVQNPALAAVGADLAADTDTGAGAAVGQDADLRTALPGSAVRAELKPQADNADLMLQQAREGALKAAAQPEATPAAAALNQLQPAMLEAAEAAAAAGDRLSARVGTGPWENQVGQKIVYMVGSEEQTASLTLNPPDLGPMQVVLSVSNDQASVTFSSNELEVRQALENALPRLREMMSESGIALGNATVNAGMPDGRQAQQDQGAQAGRSARGAAGRRDAVGGVAGGADTAARPATRTAILGDRGMVDTFA